MADKMKSGKLQVAFDANHSLMKESFVSTLLAGSATRRLVSSFGCTIAPLPKDPNPVWRKTNVHIPPQREAFLVLEGRVQNSLNGQVYEAESGDLFLFDLGDLHDKFISPSAPDSVTLCFQIYKDFLYGYFAIIQDGRRTLTNRMLFTSSGLSTLLNSAWDRRHGDGLSCKTSMIQTLSVIDYIFAEVACIKHESGNQIAVMPSSEEKLTAQHVVGLVMIHIDERNGRDCNLDEITQFSGFSAAHINRIFLANLGYSIKDHANAWRLNRMRELLRNGLSMKEIAYDLGFSSAAAFSRWKSKNKV